MHKMLTIEIKDYKKKNSRIFFILHEELHCIDCVFSHHLNVPLNKFNLLKLRTSYVQIENLIHTFFDK